jgi:hypothetical protein
MGRLIGSIIVLVVVIFGVAWAFGLVNLDQTRDAKLPSIAVQGGQLPKFDADVAKVDVGTRQETVAVPTVSVDKPQK